MISDVLRIPSWGVRSHRKLRCRKLPSRLNPSTWIDIMTLESKLPYGEVDNLRIIRSSVANISFSMHAAWRYWPISSTNHERTWMINTNSSHTIHSCHSHKFGAVHNYQVISGWPYKIPHVSVRQWTFTFSIELKHGRMILHISSHNLS